MQTFKVGAIKLIFNQLSIPHGTNLKISEKEKSKKKTVAESVKAVKHDDDSEHRKQFWHKFQKSLENRLISWNMNITTLTYEK